MAGDGSLLLDERGEVHRLGVPKGTVRNPGGRGGLHGGRVRGRLAGAGAIMHMPTAWGRRPEAPRLFSDGLARQADILALLEQF